MSDVFSRYRELRAEIPSHVSIVGAVKTRTADEVRAFIEAGGRDIGHNYVQEAEKLRAGLGDDARRVRWHMIGHLQTNKINKCLDLFDMVQTVDTVEKAEAIDERAGRRGASVLPVLIEVNIGSESSKKGAMPDSGEIARIAERISALNNIKLEGLMTMGPAGGDEDALRLFFRKTREIFDGVAALNLPGVSMRTLSMGMSDSYRIAIEEGSTMVRLGTVLFGGR